jgi:hypothetical protein
VSAFTTAWNQKVSGTNVPSFGSNVETDQIAGVLATVADLGGNIRMAVISANAGAPVSQAMLIWLPDLGGANQATQNQLYRDAYAVLIQTVNPSAAEADIITLGQTLGLSASNPPAPSGSTTTGTLPPENYELFTASPSGIIGASTVLSVVSSLAR